MSRSATQRSAGAWRLPVALSILAFMLVLALMSMLWVPTSAHLSGPTLAWPDAAFWLGTDALGRDLLAQLLAAIAASLLFAAFSTLVAGVVGLAGGAALALLLGAGRPVEPSMLLLAPILVVAMLLAGLGMAGAVAALFAIVVVGSWHFAGLVRHEIARLLASDVLAAARMAGLPLLVALQRHGGRPLLLSLLARLAQLMALGLAAEAMLAAVGLGPNPPGPGLGQLLHDAQNVLQLNPLPAVLPALTLLTLLLALELLASGLSRGAPDV